MSEFMMDVNDAMRAKKVQELWNKYGRLLVGVIVTAILATVISVAWHAHMNKVLAKDTDALMVVLDKGDKADIKDIQALSDKAHQPIKGVVDLILAQKQEMNNDLKAAAATYEGITTQSRVPDATRAVARLHYVRLGLVTDIDNAKLLSAIEPLAKAQNGFQPSALEMKGLLLRRSGKNAAANKIFRELATSTTASATLRQRAKALIVNEDIK